MGGTLRRPPAPRHAAVWVAGMAIALLWLAPIFWMVSTSFKLPSQILTADIQWLPRTWTLENYTEVFTRPVARWFVNSLVTSVGTTGVALTTGALAGYALARLNFPGRSVIFLVMVAALMVPSEMTIIPLFLVFLKLKLINSYIAVILPSFGTVFSVYLFRQFFLTLPMELEDAAAIDGCGALSTFWRVALPLARPAIVAGTALLFTSNWNAFLWPLLVLQREEWKTLPVGMARYSSVIGVGGQTQIDSIGSAMAAVTLLAVPTLLMFLLLQRYFVEGVKNTGIKG